MKALRKSTLAVGATRPLMVGAMTAILAVSGCGPNLEVHNLPAPDAELHGRVTFRVVERPMARDSMRPTQSTDGYRDDSGQRLEQVMLNNGIIDRRVRDDITRAFVARGYTVVEERPDFVVLYSTEALEVTDVDDAYDTYSRWWGYCCDVDEYTEATVVIDVVDPRNGKLLWRGGGESRVSDDPDKYARQLTRAVDAIVAKYPVATPPSVAVGQGAEEAAQ